MIVGVFGNQILKRFRNNLCFRLKIKRDLKEKWEQRTLPTLYDFILSLGPFRKSFNSAHVSHALGGKLKPKSMIHGPHRGLRVRVITALANAETGVLRATTRSPGRDRLGSRTPGFCLQPGSC